MGVQDLTSLLSGDLSRFTGDPCLPAEYKYPWLNCTGKGILPTRVTSMWVDYTLNIECLSCFSSYFLSIAVNHVEISLNDSYLLCP